MKQIIQCCVIVLLATSAAHAKLKIVTTTTDYADLARQIGGDDVEVRSVMKGPENVHNVLAKPTEMLALNKADLFVHSGLDAEPWRDNLVKGARNPRVLSGRPGDVDMSRGIELIDVPSGRVDRSDGDQHAYGSPHYALDPANAQRMTATLVRAMAGADPAHADAYRANAKRVVTELAELHRKLRDDLAPYGGLKVVTFHKAWGYFARAFDLNVVATIEPKPAITPSPAQVRDVVAKMKAEGVRVVIVETYSDSDLAASVAEKAGAKLVRLPEHVLGVAEAATYQDLFRYNVAQVIEAARAAGVEPAKPGPAKEAAGAR
jgi:zinc/manganese transport system substrate-binding protein